MPINFKPKEEVKRSYKRFVLAGVGGIGKSTAIATAAKAPLVIDLDGRFPVALIDKAQFLAVDASFQSVMAGLRSILAEEKFSFDWLVIDTATKAMSSVEDNTIAKHCAGEKDKYNAYGFGLKFSPQYFKEMLDVIDQIQNKHKTNCAFVCHTKVRDFKNPMTESYSKNVLDLPDIVADRLKQWADYLGFAFFEVNVDKEKHKAVGEPTRYISFTDSPLHEAKNSSEFPIPKQILLDKEGKWAEIVFGETQVLVKEIKTLAEKFPEPKRAAMLEMMEKTGILNSGVKELKEFLDAGKKELAKSK